MPTNLALKLNLMFHFIEYFLSIFSTVYYNCILYCLSITFYMMVFEVENNPLLHSLVEKNPQKCENLTEVEEFPPSLY